MTALSLSLNEAEALAKKAARGAGYPWGLAEEAGRAVGWLEARGLPGCGALAALLSGGGDATPPVIGGSVWRPAAGALCPIATGAALSDRAGLPGGVPLEIGPIREVLLIVPFAAATAAARAGGGTITLTWAGGAAVTDGVDAEVTGPATVCCERLAVTVGGRIDTPAQCRSRACPSQRDFDALSRFAGLTYAPATEESRAKGAGAGASDND